MKSHVENTRLVMNLHYTSFGVLYLINWSDVISNAWRLLMISIFVVTANDNWRSDTSQLTRRTLYVHCLGVEMHAFKLSWSGLSTGTSWYAHNGFNTENWIIDHRIWNLLFLYLLSKLMLWPRDFKFDHYWNEELPEAALHVVWIPFHRTLLTSVAAHQSLEIVAPNPFSH
jgi:hypothetical protein